MPDIDQEYQNFINKQKEIADLLKKREIDFQNIAKDVFSKIQEQNYVHAGAGSYYSQFYKNYSHFDRFGTRYITPNKENSGLIFITRPRLCLQSANLRVNRFLSLFNTSDPNCVQFMIRNYLDPCLTTGDFSEFCPSIVQAARVSPFFDPKCGFMPLLTNNLRDATGFPDDNIQTETLDGGFFGENQEIAVGSDRNKKSFDVQLSFTDPQGGSIMALFQVWLAYIALVTVGEVVAYSDDISQGRLNYTVSLYRFTLDTSRKYIRRFAKCTGCFPISRPSGASFDISRSETFIDAAKDFSITFKCNGWDENDPIVVEEFNTVSKRYCPDIDSSVYIAAPPEARYNYTGYPWIHMEPNKPPELQFRYLQDPDKSVDNFNKDLKNKIKSIDNINKEYNKRVNDLIYV